MTITVSTPDGGTAEFPDGTSTDVMTSALRAMFGGPGDSGSSDSKPWFSATGTDKVGEFVGKMGDAATGGFLASALDKLGLAQGPGGQTVAQQVDAAGKDIGPVGSALADVTGYAIGPGKLGIATSLGRGAEAFGAGSRLASGLGSAGEAALATGAGQTPGLDVLYAGGLGGALGASIGGRGPAPPATVGEAALQAAKDAAFRKLDATPVKTADVQSAIDSSLGQ